MYDFGQFNGPRVTITLQVCCEILSKMHHVIQNHNGNAEVSNYYQYMYYFAIVAVSHHNVLYAVNCSHVAQVSSRIFNSLLIYELKDNISA